MVTLEQVIEREKNRNRQLNGMYILEAEDAWIVGYDNEGFLPVYVGISKKDGSSGIETDITLDQKYPNASQLKLVYSED